MNISSCHPFRLQPFYFHEIRVVGWLIVGGGSLPPLPRYSIWWISNNPDVINGAVENRGYKICSETHRNSLIPEDLIMA